MLDNASDDPDRLVKGFEKQLDEMSRQAAAQALQSANSGMEGEIYTPTLQVPDLVTLVGKESAENLIRRALVAPVQLSVGVGDDTRALTQRLALEMIDQLKVAQWSLVCTLVFATSPPRPCCKTRGTKIGATRRCITCSGSLPTANPRRPLPC
jgi:hypothetical protein